MKSAPRRPQGALEGLRAASRHPLVITFPLGLATASPRCPSEGRSRYFVLDAIEQQRNAFFAEQWLNQRLFLPRDGGQGGLCIRSWKSKHPGDHILPGKSLPTAKGSVKSKSAHAGGNADSSQNSCTEMMEGWSSVPSTCIRAQPTYAKVEVSVSPIDPETMFPWMTTYLVAQLSNRVSTHKVTGTLWQRHLTAQISSTLRLMDIWILVILLFCTLILCLFSTVLLLYTTRYKYNII